jgi:hypothetical protein
MRVVACSTDRQHTSTWSVNSRRVRHPIETARASFSLEAVSRSLQRQEEPMSKAAEVIPDVMVLSALDRAMRHRGRGHTAVPVWDIYAHLDIAQRSAAAKHVRAQLDVLDIAGAVARSRRHGVQTWTLTPAGRRRLQRARRVGRIPEMPESPQHQTWRNAHTLAGQEIECFRQSVRACLDEVALLLDADPPARSDAFFEIAERLRFECWRFASVTYCLLEWVEPDDARAEVDDHLEPGERTLGPSERARLVWRRRGRRNVTLWDRAA